MDYWTRMVIGTTPDVVMDDDGRMSYTTETPTEQVDDDDSDEDCANGACPVR